MPIVSLSSKTMRWIVTSLIVFSGSEPKTTPIVIYGPASSGVFFGAGKMLRISKSASVARWTTSCAGASALSTFTGLRGCSTASFKKRPNAR